MHLSFSAIWQRAGLTARPCTYVDSSLARSLCAGAHAFTLALVAFMPRELLTFTGRDEEIVNVLKYHVGEINDAWDSMHLCAGLLTDVIALRRLAVPGKVFAFDNDETLEGTNEP